MTPVPRADMQRRQSAKVRSPSPTTPTPHSPLPPNTPTPHSPPPQGEWIPAEGAWPVAPQHDVDVSQDRIWVDGCFDFAHHGT